MCKNLLIAALCFVTLFSCKTYQDAKSDDILYSNFTQNQKSWSSTDGKISYIDKGQGQPILLLHGIPTSGWLYRKMIDPLVEKGFRVIVPDMLGFGNSDSPKGYDIYDKKAHAQRILGLMNHLQINKWHQVLHDAGGLWTWEMLKIAPEKVSKLTILNTIIYKEGFNPPVKMSDNAMAKLVKWSYSTNTNLMLCQLFKNGMNDFEMSENDVEGYKTPLKNEKTDALNKFFTTNTKSIPDYSETLKSLNTPVQVIWGKYDEILKWEAQSKKVIADLKIKESNIHILDKNHFLQEEVPKELVSIIGGFVTKE